MPTKKTLKLSILHMVFILREVHPYQLIAWLIEDFVTSPAHHERWSQGDRSISSVWSRFVYCTKLRLQRKIILHCQRQANGGSSVGRARDSGWGGPGFDPRCGHLLPTGWVGVSIMWPAETKVMVSPLCLLCGSTYNSQMSVLGPVRDIA